MTVQRTVQDGGLNLSFVVPGCPIANPIHKTPKPSKRLLITEVTKVSYTGSDGARTRNHRIDNPVIVLI